MNNTGSLRRTEFEALASGITRRGVATTIATTLFAILLISFRPFAEPGAGVTGGDIVNQVGFTLLGGVSVFSLLAFVDRKVLAALPSFWWMVMLGFFLVSVLHAEDPPAALRTASFTLIGITTVAAILTLPRDADSFSTTLAVAGLAVVILCYVGLFLYPDIARHTADSQEPQHAGFWRGAFTHKNVAGPVMACLAFGGFYLWRRGRTASGIALFLMAIVFMANTGSKTTVGLVPLAMLVVIAPSLLGLRVLVPWLFALAVGGAALGTIGIVMSDTLWGISQRIAPGLTFTGRTALWEFLLEMIAKKPWTGYGYESFWGTMFIFTQDQPFDRDWDIRGIVHGHNGYLDIAVLMGVPAMIWAAVTFLVVPLIDFARTPPRRENVLLADFFLMILLFTALNAFLESFFFRRADPVWLFLVMATLGLRLVARFPIRSRIAS